jgi:hypothetical protein
MIHLEEGAGTYFQSANPWSWDTSYFFFTFSSSSSEGTLLHLRNLAFSLFLFSLSKMQKLILQPPLTSYNQRNNTVERSATT